MTDEQEHDRIALIDIDGTLADYDGAMRAELEKLQSPDDRPLFEDLYLSAASWHVARMKLIKNQPGFWRNLPPIPAGMAIYDLLGKLRYRRMILTKGPRTTTGAWTEKADWCSQHVPSAGLLVVRSDEEDGAHKGLVYGKVLFDDFPDYILQWLKWRPRGHVIMLDSASNRGFSHPNVLRVYPYEAERDQHFIDEQLVRVEQFLGRRNGLGPPAS